MTLAVLVHRLRTDFAKFLPGERRRWVTRIPPRERTPCRLAHSPASAALARTAFADQPMRVHSPAPHAHGVRSLHRLVYRSLAFLHKKTWHTANLKNVEKVWAAEEEQKKEEQKLERWKKEREEERQQAELRALQDEMSKTKRETRVDFLYEQPQTNAQEYLLGKAVLEKPEESDVKKVEVLPGSNFINGQNNLSNAVNEEFNKLNNDPLIMMRSEEQKVGLGHP